MAMPISAEAKEDLKEMDLLPRKHIMADRSREKVGTQRTQEIVVPYRRAKYFQGYKISRILKISL